jgi:glycosyltransferase involved in cell wall biosynthesis
MTKKILFILLGDRTKASARVRGFWIAEELELLGCQCKLTWHNNKFNILKLAFQILNYNTVIFQKTYSRYHLLLLLWARLLGKKVFLDIDDAPSRINKKNTLKNFSYMVWFSTNVFCGSHNLIKLVDSIKKKKALFIPTAVKLENYNPIDKRNSKICIGWVGNGKHYQKDLIQLLVEPLKILSQRHQIRFKLIGACAVESLYSVFGAIKNLELDFIDELNWSGDDVVGLALSDVDIGVYPLLNNDFNNLKCGFKALEYMAMKIPVVSSPITVNKEIVSDKENGYLVNSSLEWVEAIEDLILNKQKRTSYGVNGLTKVRNEYSTKFTARLILNYLNK